MTRFGLWRAEHEITYAELEDLTGLSASVLCRVASGKRSLKPETKVAVARRLGVPIRDLFEVEHLDDEVSA